MATDRTRTAPAPDRALNPARVVALLPERLGDWKRVSLEPASAGRTSGGVAARGGPTLSADYERNALAATLSIDTSSSGNASVAQWNGPPVDSATATGREALYKRDGRIYRERFDKASHESSVTCTLGNGLVLVAISGSADLEALRGLVDAVDLKRAAEMRRR